MEAANQAGLATEKRKRSEAKGIYEQSDSWDAQGI